MVGVAHFLQGPSRSVPRWRQGSRTWLDVHRKGISFTIVRSILQRSTPLGPPPPLLEAPGPSFRTPSPHLLWNPLPPPRTSPGPPREPGGGVQGLEKFVEKIVEKKTLNKSLKKSSEKSAGNAFKKSARNALGISLRFPAGKSAQNVYSLKKIVEKIVQGLRGA